jgi:hypothetical protein
LVTASSSDRKQGQTNILEELLPRGTLPVPQRLLPGRYPGRLISASGEQCGKKKRKKHDRQAEIVTKSDEK